MDTEGDKKVIKIFMNDVLGVIADKYSVTTNSLKSPSRKMRHTKPRMIFYWICNKRLEKSLSEIGRFLNRDHTTILHGVRVATRESYVNNKLADVILEEAKQRRVEWVEKNVHGN